MSAQTHAHTKSLHNAAHKHACHYYGITRFEITNRTHFMDARTHFNPDKWMSLSFLFIFNIQIHTFHWANQTVRLGSSSRSHRWVTKCGRCKHGYVAVNNDNSTNHSCTKPDALGQMASGARESIILVAELLRNHSFALGLCDFNDNIDSRRILWARSVCWWMKWTPIALSLSMHVVSRVSTGIIGLIRHAFKWINARKSNSFQQRLRHGDDRILRIRWENCNFYWDVVHRVSLTRTLFHLRINWVSNILSAANSTKRIASKWQTNKMKRNNSLALYT